MTRLGEGDEPALNVLMHRWEKALIRFIARYSNNHSDAVDLAQETFVRIYEHRKRYRAKSKFSTWMFAIAANLCRNHARWQSRHPSVSPVPEDGRDLADTLVAESDAPDAANARSDEAEIVRRAVQELPHDLRIAILLFEYEDLTQAQIAKVLKCSTKAVESRLYRARKALRISLRELI